SISRSPLRPSPFPYTPLFRSGPVRAAAPSTGDALLERPAQLLVEDEARGDVTERRGARGRVGRRAHRAIDEHDHRVAQVVAVGRSEEHTSELQSRFDLVCRLL